jgi:antitoxin (DNA-binding transcriptional repressor) of toxin-antitoxin stability system
MYNVHIMEHLKVAEARARFGEMLDEAEQGGEVVIERQGVRFRLVAENKRPAGASKVPLFDFVDPDVMTGQWTWKVGSKGAAFAARRKRR